MIAARGAAREFGQWRFERQNIPQTELEPIEPGSELPGGLRALSDGRRRNETPVWLPEQRTLVCAAALIGAEGGLLIWDTPHLERARPALRELLELPFERVIVSHGEHLHDPAADERALELPPWRAGGGRARRPSPRRGASIKRALRPRTPRPRSPYSLLTTQERRNRWNG